MKSQIEKVIEKKDLVFIDSSTIDLGSFFDKSDKYNNTYDYNTTDLNKMIIRLKRFEEVLYLPSSRTIPEVTKELKSFNKKAGYRFKKLLKPQLLKNRQRNAKINNKLYDKSKKVCELYNQLQEQTHTITKISKEIELVKPTKEKEIILSLVKTLDRVLHLKQTKKQWLKTSVDTDEKLVVQACYAAWFEGKQVAISTNNADIPRLVYATRKMFQSVGFKKIAPDVYSNSIHNPITIYFPRFNILVDGVNEHTKKRLNLHPATRDQIKELARKTTAKRYELDDLLNKSYKK